MSSYRITAILVGRRAICTSLFGQPEKLFRLRGEVTGGPRDQSGLSA